MNDIIIEHASDDISEDNKALHAKLEALRAECTRLIKVARANPDYYCGGDCVSADELEWYLQETKER